MNHCIQNNDCECGENEKKKILKVLPAGSEEEEGEVETKKRVTRYFTFTYDLPFQDFSDLNEALTTLESIGDLEELDVETDEVEMTAEKDE